MTKLTPARKALLQKLVDAGGEVPWKEMSENEYAVAYRAENRGFCEFGCGVWRITQDGLKALQKDGET